MSLKINCSNQLSEKYILLLEHVFDIFAYFFREWWNMIQRYKLTIAVSCLLVIVFVIVIKYRPYINMIERQEAEGKHFDAMLLTGDSTGKCRDRSQSHSCIKTFVFFFFK
jgi:hypothetical protein